MKKNCLILFLIFLTSSIKINAQGHWHMYAMRDSAVTNVNTPVVIHVLSNDSLVPEPGSVFYLLTPFACDYPYVQGVLSSVNGGTLLFLNNDSIKYTPPLNFIGKDNFIYGICNNGGTYQYDTSTVSIRVKSVTTRLTDIFSQLNINLNPNPSKGKLQINILNYDNTNSYEVLFLNNIGETIKQEAIDSPSTTINTEALIAGIYFVHIRDKNYFSISKKIIIE
jgi:hypothetical protein